MDTDIHNKDLALITRLERETEGNSEMAYSDFPSVSLSKRA